MWDEGAPTWPDDLGAACADGIIAELACPMDDAQDDIVDVNDVRAVAGFGGQSMIC